MDYSQKTLKDQWIMFLEAIKFDLGVTLTLKQKRKRNDGTFQKLTKSDASETLNHFLNMLNTKIYGRSYSKFENSLNYVTVIENGGYKKNKNIHIHAAISYPYYMNTHEERNIFKKLLIDLWSKCNWADAEYHFEELYNNDGWIRYITKEGGDAIDLDNIQLSKNLVPLKNIQKN